MSSKNNTHLLRFPLRPNDMLDHNLPIQRPRQALQPLPSASCSARVHLLANLFSPVSFSITVGLEPGLTANLYSPTTPLKFT